MPRVLYLHGFASGPGSKKAWFLMARFASEGISLDAPDLTEGDFEHTTITQQLSVVERATRGEPIPLIGSSMGAYVAALYAARHPEVPRVVLLAPAFRFARRLPQALAPAQADDWKRSGSLPVWNYAAEREARISYELIEDGLGYEDFPVVLQPTLVIHGRHDDVVPCELAEEFVRLRPNATLHLMDSDHELISALPLLWEEVKRFLLR